MAVLELAIPEPPDLAEEAALQASWRDADYEADRKRPFRAFEPHTRHTLGLEMFEAVDAMAGPAGPFIGISLLEKEKITVSKTHEVVTRSRITGGVKREQETIPIYSLWRWPDDQPACPGELIRITVKEFEDTPGAWHEFFGETDDKGRLQIPLAPLLNARALVGRRTPLHLIVTNPQRDLALTLTVPYDLIAHFARQQQR